MDTPPQSSFEVPRGLDEKICNATYKAALRAREESFKGELKRLSRAYKLDAEIATATARDLGSQPITRPASEIAINLRRERVRMYTPIFADDPHYAPIGSALATPPYFGAYAFSDVPQGIFAPNGPDRSNGNCGGTIDMSQFASIGVAENGFMAPDLAPVGTNQITVTRTLNGIYDIWATANSVTGLRITLVATLIVNNGAGPVVSQSQAQLLVNVAADNFNHGQNVGTINGIYLPPTYDSPGNTSDHFNVTFNFYPGVTLPYSSVMATVGVNQVLSCPGPEGVSGGLVQTLAVISSIAIT